MSSHKVYNLTHVFCSLFLPGKPGTLTHRLVSGKGETLSHPKVTSTLAMPARNKWDGSWCLASMNKLIRKTK
jgi:hypothetical protein